MTQKDSIIEKDSMIEKDRVDELVNLLDSFMEQGGGHMNVIVEKEAVKLSQEEELTGLNIVKRNEEMIKKENEEEISMRMEVYQSTDCSLGNMACAVPTIHQGIDEE